MTASGLTVLTRIPCGPPSSARQRARCSDAAFADEYAAALLPATSAFFEATKTIEPPRPCSSRTRKRLARREEVAAREHRVVQLPVLERRLGDRRARREAGRGDEDVEAAVLEHRAARQLGDRVLARHVDVRPRARAASRALRRAPRRPPRAPSRLRSATTTCAPRAARTRAVARPMPLAPPVITATRPASSPRGGACASL